MNFSQALNLLKEGNLMCRASWNKEEMFIALVSGSIFLANRASLLEIFSQDTSISYSPYLDPKTATEKLVPWVAMQTDLLADDWQIYDSTRIA